MARSLASKPNVTAPAGAYPYGRIKDNTGINDGTPINEEVYGDLHQFFEKLAANGGLTFNDLPDNSTNGFELFLAYILSGNKNFSSDIIKALSNYTTDDLLILHGCTISATIPGSSTITAGSIYYNGVIYKVPADTVVTTGSETLVYDIDITVQPNTIKLQAGASGSGIANYDSATVKTLHKLYNKAEQSEVDGIQANKADKNQGSYTTITLINGWSGTLKYRKDQFGMVNIKGSINAVSSTDPQFFVGFSAIQYKSGNQGYITVTGKHNTNTTTIGGIIWNTPSYSFINVNSYPDRIADFGVDVTYLIDLWYYSE